MLWPEAWKSLILEGQQKPHTRHLREPIHIDRYRYWLWLTETEERCWVPFSDILRLIEWPAEYFGITFSVHCKTAHPRYHSLMNLVTSLIIILSKNQFVWHEKRSSPELFHLYRSFMTFRVAAGVIMAVTETQTSENTTTSDTATADHQDINLTDFIITAPGYCLITGSEEVCVIHEAALQIPKARNDLYDDALIHDIVVHRWFDMMCFSTRCRWSTITPFMLLCGENGHPTSTAASWTCFATLHIALNNS